MIRNATLSPDRKYRYLLTRAWGEYGPSVTWIMLNPSTADAEIDDPTIRRCIAFSKRLGAAAMAVVNLFAYRATDPDELVEVGGTDAIGPDNGGHVRAACDLGGPIIAAWGALGKPLRGAADEIARFMRRENYSLKCLGKTKDGSPRHPLYVRADAPLIEWP
jgi:hypothetical protein